MTDNPSLNNSKSIEESLERGWFYPPMNYPKQKSELTEKAIKDWLDLIKKDPVMVIDLNTLRLRPPKYK
jgi:hypothetical protein